MRAAVRGHYTSYEHSYCAGQGVLAANNMRAREREQESECERERRERKEKRERREGGREGRTKGGRDGWMDGWREGGRERESERERERRAVPVSGGAAFLVSEQQALKVLAAAAS
jgi:hypothetical protein